MTTTEPLDDRDVQRAVSQELQWTPGLDDAAIGVAVKDGAVALSGEVNSYSERLAVKHAALRVRGVSTVVDDIVVRPTHGTQITDIELAREVDHALHATANVPITVKAVIDDGEVTLMGEVEWDHQRRSAKRSVQHLRGVRNVNSLITLSARPSASDAEERIRGAILRNAAVDANAVSVKIEGTRAILTGTVRSWPEKSQAADAAWASPHVTSVDNRIEVRAR
ncbi:osmotically-inducible protein OsmY [Microbacterium foliorum]|uniref:Osmotically-inducible protein OsmY n=1 Tax=Microbacterium foliorum TaxID=104336 RepID=A0ABU1HPF0_9MICO|nr:BON domain-containing protein [Microbacterium foliorum]MDR6141518.1 osmotically-inducible protein OsmY [Microbacterium foliorum]